MNWMAVLWFCLLVLFTITEASTVTLTSIWFAVGALFALIASFLTDAVWLQTVLFFGVSAVLLLLLRPWSRRYLTPKKTKTNVDAVIGMQGVVIEPIDNLNAGGRVKLGAMEWAARSSDGQPIAVGTQICADRIEGVKVFVTPVKADVKV